ncbi:MAG: AHH domain-containing protein [Hyalangium sp.]|uniref:AHH domain-containing protein n=1 Tax=Hyalangium sp. TaxID=2028555 RepID=UPI0038998B64
MRSASCLLRLFLALCLAASSSCATSQADISEDTDRQVRPAVVAVTRLGDDQFQWDFAPLPPDPFYEVLREDEARAALAAFLACIPEAPPFEVVPAMALTGGKGAPWEQRLRAEFLARYGPPLLPMPGSLERSPLFMALRLSPRYMGQGIRDAARELFRSPVFLASVALSIVVYFSAWLLPEPLFSKAFAATLTARLALVVGLLELRNVALACLQLYRDAQAARTVEELEGVAERFGHALGGTALRVLVMVASYGVAKALPNVPPGGLGPLLSSPRYALAGGLTFQSASTAHVVADGTLVIAGAAVGTAASGLGSACSDGSQKKEGSQWHHLATDKNEISADTGGPWTPQFERLFAMAGMSLDDPANRVYLQGHKGPHPEAYHQEIYRRLRSAVLGCKSLPDCRSKLVTALEELARDVCTPGSRLHRLVTKAQE